jgi:ABC-type Fe3+/spermidine/putrescine transport system ATPase subunit
MEEKLSEDYIITVDRVNKVFPNGVHALRKFSINVRRKEVLVVIGPSGSGKSTFLRCLNGLEDIDSGAIVVDGIPLNDRKENRLEIRKEVGMVFQSFNLFPHLTVLENVNLAQVLVSKKKQRRGDRDLDGPSSKGRYSGKGKDLSQSSQRRPAATGRHCQGLGHDAEGHAL